LPWYLDTPLSTPSPAHWPQPSFLTYHSQCREVRFMALTHNVMILSWREVFYRAGRSSFTFLLGRVTPNANTPKTANEITAGSGMTYE